jgi:peptidoglycan/xylan/chitin deacetylase (PgdA/CDA1 family)
MYLTHNRPWWAAASLGYWSGLRGQERRRDGIRVICYHGVVERKQDARLERNLQLLSDFQSQVNLLRRFRVLSLDELTDQLPTSPKRSKRTAVITFDDGYANNLLAAEVLDRAHLPWSVFITTGAVGREQTIWTVALSLLLLHGQAERLEVLNRVWPLNTRTERETAFQEIRYPLKSMSSELRQRTMNCIQQQFPGGETQHLLSKFPSLQLLSWQEVRQLASGGVGIGSHGVTHEIHHEAQPESVRLFELSESKSELERQLGHSCNVFAFPNGNFVASSASEILDAGYKLALTTQRGTFKPNVHQHMVPRLWTMSSLRDFSKNFFWEPKSAPDEV